MIVYETKFHQLLVNKSHDDCSGYVCTCKDAKPWRFWVMNIQKPLNSGWREFNTEADAIAEALIFKPEVVKYELNKQEGDSPLGLKLS